MKKTFFTLVITIAVSLGNSAFAQTTFSGWLASFNSFKTGKKTSIHADVQWRSADEWKYTQTLLLRSGLNIHLNKQFTATGGYAYISNRRLINQVSGYMPEHRIWEQVLFNHKIKNFGLTHRLRLEQRFLTKSTLKNDELVKDGTAYANRLRYFFRTMVPLHRGPLTARTAFAAVQNEVFTNIGNKENVNGKFFDQNRLYLALGYRLTSSIDLEAGYMNQYINGRGSAFTNNHILQLASYLRL